MTKKHSITGTNICKLWSQMRKKRLEKTGNFFIIIRTVNVFLIKFINHQWPGRTKFVKIAASNCSLYRRQLVHFVSFPPDIYIVPETYKIEQFFTHVLVRNSTWSRATTIYIDRLETVCFFRLFIREGDMEYTGCDNKEHRGLKARVLPWMPSCPD